MTGVLTWPTRGEREWQDDFAGENGGNGQDLTREDCNFRGEPFEQRIV